MVLPGRLGGRVEHVLVETGIAPGGLLQTPASDWRRGSFFIDIWLILHYVYIELLRQIAGTVGVGIEALRADLTDKAQLV